MKKFLPIVKSPNPILFEKAHPIKKFDSDLKKLIDAMIPTMRKADGMGLAAPQIGKSLRVAVLEFTPKKDNEKKLTPIPLMVLINPKIISKSEKLETLEEGCLSLPDINLEITRPDEVDVIYQDQNGSRKRVRATGMLSRMLQHEIDHLNGILITDRHADMTESEEIVQDQQ